MRVLAFPSLMALTLALLLSGPRTVSAATEPARELQWEDLMPTDWVPVDALAGLSEEALEGIADDSEEARRLMDKYVEAKRAAPVVAELDGQRVRLPGFIVPLDFEGTDISEFLLVPYFGACIHVPPPPSNQIVFVKVSEAYPLRELFEAVWVTGTLSTKAFLNDLGDAGYTLQATVVEPYE